MHILQSSFFFVLLLPILIFSNMKESSCDSHLPSFLIIGAQKSGTRALYRTLCQHPQVVYRPGEVHFFDIFYDRGVNWYKDQYPKSERLDAIRGDKSPYYLFHPLAPERAHALIPNAKVIVILRNPIDRAYSQYWMNVRRGRETLSFQDAIQAEEERLQGEEDKILASGITSPSSNHRRYSYLSRGIYIEQLISWLRYYPLEQMTIISYDDLRQDPQKVINELVLFLNLQSYDDFDFKVGKIHVYPDMDPALRAELSDFFRSHNEKLEMLLNRKFNWD